ncbi:hypothetical protein GGP68_003531 [Salinibacter ruber]|uniref:Uncharacterized protein n=1 Tax=Salinibacter ruber TaxID=146919 RepID=A0A9X2V7Y0_9BACT|nr:hypothetical protein [Salinibacter ruber]MCS3711852.1 hypothetical protein [Salinibacter ruber]MCS3824510.1 hypothetical protein [Salinibacter ruber]MCS4116333.1 hypothetical protein [Salinibacter ruber]MCS4122768.1 hypothetical protein [Salinibacter ruber]
MPLTLISQAANDLIPSSLSNVTSKISIFLHVLHREILGPQITSKSWASRVVSFSMKSLRRS